MNLTTVQWKQLQSTPSCMSIYMATLRKIFFFMASLTHDFFSPSHLKNFHHFGGSEILSDGIFYWSSSYKTQILQETSYAYWVLKKSSHHWCCKLAWLTQLSKKPTYIRAHIFLIDFFINFKILSVIGFLSFFIKLRMPICHIDRLLWNLHPNQQLKLTWDLNCFISPPFYSNLLIWYRKPQVPMCWCNC